MIHCLAYSVGTVNIDPREIEILVDAAKGDEGNLVLYQESDAQVVTTGTHHQHAINPAELEHYVSATRCINCFCCASACISSHRNFLGPNAMLATIVRVMDPRELEKTERLKCLYSDQGVYRCHSSRACSFVCPKEIDVAHFIAKAKEGKLAPE